MENQRASSPAAFANSTHFWVDPRLKPAWIEACPSLQSFTEDAEKAAWRIEEKNGDLVLSDRKRVHLSLPMATANMRFMADTLLELAQASTAPSDNWEDRALIELSEMAQPIFFGTVIDIEAKNYLSKLSATISLKSGLDGFFQLRRFKEFNLGVLLVHQKGESQAWQIGVGNSPDSFTHSLELDKFNSFYTTVKKSKNGQFTTQQSKNQWLPFGGSFLAESFSFRRFNAVWVITREEFLSCGSEEVSQFRYFSQLQGLWLERLIELEFSDLRLAEIMWVLDRCPLPIVLQDSQGVAIFTNAAYPAQTHGLELTWISLGKGHELGVGKIEDWDSSQIDVFHKHKISLLGDLFNTLRHELSNPLFGLGLACDLLLTSDSPDDTLTMLKEIKKNVLRSQLIIHNLSKLYSDQDSALTCDVVQVLNEALTLAKSELKAVRKYQAPAQLSGPLMVEGRPLLVVQILFNLLVNSAQAMRSQSTPAEIRINVEVLPDRVEITLGDNGPGLPALIRENLFRPFHTTKTQGHGLGLALSRDLALKIGGDLTYLETSPGASFRLTLKRVS